jgi:hypothetical protein
MIGHRKSGNAKSFQFNSNFQAEINFLAQCGPFCPQFCAREDLCKDRLWRSLAMVCHIEEMDDVCLILLALFTFH